jgi:hypothetical protein
MNTIQEYSIMFVGSFAKNQYLQKIIVDIFYSFSTRHMYVCNLVFIVRRKYYFNLKGDQFQRLYYKVLQS